MAGPNKTVDQNILPVQALFNLDNSFNTFIGQGQPFYATVNPVQSGLTITNSTINSSVIGGSVPAAATFTSMATTTGTVSTTPVGNTDIANKLYVDATAAGLSWKQPVLCATTANITLSGLQTIDTISVTAGSRVLVKNQSTQANNGIYIASSGAWTYAPDANTYNQYVSAICFVESGTQAGSAWYCYVQPGGTLGTTPITWSQFSTSATYTAGTGLTLSAFQFSITNTAVTAGSYGSASSVGTFTVNAQGQLTAASSTPISIAPSQINATIPNSGLTNSSVTFNGVSVSLGGSGTITAQTPNALTIGTGLSGGSFNGSSAVTIANTGVLSFSAGTTGFTPTTATTGAVTLGGTLNVANGGTGATTLTGYVYGNGTGAMTASTTIPTSVLTGNFVSTFSGGTTGLTPSSATAGAITLSGTLAVANGGTGVTSSSGANSVVLRDSNGNITTNCLFEGFTTQAASGTTITLTASSVQSWVITGSGGQTIKLPDATTLPSGALFEFNNNQSSGAITVVNNSNTTIATINSGGYVSIVLLSNSTAAGSWDRHDSTPSNVSWSTNTLDYPGSITSATWNGNSVALNRGGTNANLTAVAGGVVYSGASALAISAAGTTGQVLTSNGSSAPTWSTPTAYATVTDDTTTNATFYPLFGSVTSGNLTTEYTSSTKYKYNPSTGTLTATVFSGSGASLTSIPNSALNNSSITIGTTAISLGGTATTIAGLTSVTSTTFVGALTGNASTATTATTATVASNVYVTDNTSSSSTFYPTMSPGTAASTNYALGTSSSKLSFVPSTGTLSATVFSGSGASLTSIPNSALTNSSVTVNGTAIALGASGTVTAAAGTLTGTTLNSTVVSSSLTSVGTIATGVWNGTAIGATYGGTGQTAVTTGDLLYGSATNTWSRLGIGSSGQILRVVSGVPAWGADYTGTVTSVAATVPSFLSISGSPITTSGTLAISYSGTALPVANGGTGITTTPSNGQIPIGNGTNYTAATLTAGTGISITNSSGSVSIASTLNTVYSGTNTVSLSSSSPQVTIAQVTLGAGTWLLVGNWDGTQSSGLGSVGTTQQYTINTSAAIPGFNSFGSAYFQAQYTPNVNTFQAAASTLSLLVTISSSTTFYLYGGPTSVPSTLNCVLTGFLNAVQIF